MNSKIWTWLGILVIVIVVIVVLVSGNKKDNSQSGTDDILVVGAILPLTGTTAEFGEIIKNGLEAGLGNDPKVKIIYEDSKGDATPATSAFQKLTTIDDVDMVISILSKPTMPLIPLAQQNKVPLVMTLMAATDATSPDTDYVYRLFWPAQHSADIFIERVLDQNLKKIAIMQIQDEGAQSNADIIVPKLREAGVTVIHETFYGTETDFRTQLIKIKQQNPEMLTVIAVPAGVWKNVVTQARTVGITAPITDVLGVFLNPGTPESLGELANNIYTLTTPFNVGEYKSELRDEIINKLGHEPLGLTSFGYDMGILLKELTSADATTRISIKNFLQDLKTFDGVTSPYVVDDAHNIQPTMIMGQYVDGKVIKSIK